MITDGKGVTYHEVEILHHERNGSGRLLFILSAHVTYVYDNDEYVGIAFVNMGTSFPESIFFDNYAIKEYIEEVKFNFELAARENPISFKKEHLESLAQAILQLPGIEDYFIPDFLLTNTDDTGEIDLTEFYKFSIDFNLYDDILIPLALNKAEAYAEGDFFTADHFDAWTLRVISDYFKTENKEKGHYRLSYDWMLKHLFKDGFFSFYNQWPDEVNFGALIVPKEEFHENLLLFYNKSDKIIGGLTVENIDDILVKINL